MSRFQGRRVGGGAVAAVCATLAFAPRAHAANPSCDSLPNVVYGAGGSAQVPLLKQIATQLAKLATPTTVVYASAGGACVGYGNLVTPTPITGTANYWDATGAQLSCDLPTAGSDTTFAVMGNSAKLCPGAAEAPGFKEFLGPVQSINIIVPVQSSQQSISTEGAYYVWGFGAPAGDATRTITPWSVPGSIIRRDQNSFLTLFIGLATGIAPTKFQGVDAKINANTVTLVSTAANPESAIGYVSGEIADAAPDKVRTLAYQHTGQTCGYWPSSTKDAKDKANVRSGQYWLWSPVHFFAKVDGAGKVTDDKAANLIGYLTGTVAPPAGIDPFQASVAASTVPRCAMHAWRDGDLSAPYSIQPTDPCGCKFDKLATGSTTCKACDATTACDAGSTCSNGYCEVTTR